MIPPSPPAEPTVAPADLDPRTDPRHVDRRARGARRDDRRVLLSSRFDSGGVFAALLDTGPVRQPRDHLQDRRRPAGSSGTFPRRLPISRRSTARPRWRNWDESSGGMHSHAPALATAAGPSWLISSWPSVSRPSWR